MICIKDLTYQINEKVILNQIDVTFEADHLYAIIGPNGAGKSTLLKHIMGVLEAPKGCITIDGVDVGALSPKAHAKKCSFVFQENNRDFELTVEEVVAMGRYPHMQFLGGLSAKDHQIIEAVLEDLKLTHLKGRMIHTLSGGEAQKVFIARALVQQTPYLLLDEPTSMLDIHNSIDLLDELLKIKKKYQLTIILVMHDLNLAFQYASHVVLLKKGEVILSDQKKAVLVHEALNEAYGHKLSLIQEGDNMYIVPKISR